MSVLVIDGVKYNLWVPKEEKELEEIVKEHSKDIFGNNSIYFDLKQKLTSKSGIVSIPDGYVISLYKSPIEKTKYFKKRGGRLELDQESITDDVWKVAETIGAKDREQAKRISDQVVAEVKKRFDEESTPTAKEIQDTIEKVLIENGHARTAKAYILYRKQHEEIGEFSHSKFFKWYIIEGELSSHPLHEHITSQLNKFMIGIKNPLTQRELADALYHEIDSDKLLRAYVETLVCSTEIKGFLLDLISKPPRIVVVIEEKGEKVQEACEGLKVEPIVVEFKTYVREDAPNVHAHLFEPLCAIEKAAEKGRGEIGEKRLLLEHYRNWENMLAWVDDNTKNIVKVLTGAIIRLGDEITYKPHGRFLCFYRGMPSTKSIFAVFLLTKKALKVRIRTDPKTFVDIEKWTGDKVYRGWFFKQGQEREFKITDKEQIDYAIGLILHSYRETILKT
jgi:predicted transport protein